MCNNSALFKIIKAYRTLQGFEIQMDTCFNGEVNYKWAWDSKVVNKFKSHQNTVYWGNSVLCCGWQRKHWMGIYKQGVNIPAHARNAHSYPSHSTCSWRRPSRKHSMTTPHPSPLVECPYIYATYNSDDMSGSNGEFQDLTNRLIDRTIAWNGILKVSTEKSKIMTNC